MAAASRVANTYELLENILLYLPLRQLLLAQKVNKQFHAVIQDSVKIGQALFWTPSSTHYVEYETDREIGSRPRSDERWENAGSKAKVMLKNPFTHMLAQSGEVRSSTRRYAFNVSSCLVCVGDRDCHLCHASQRKPLNASLARMLLSHPPVRKVFILKNSHRMSLRVFMVSSLEGLRYGEVHTSLAAERVDARDDEVFGVLGSDDWRNISEHVDKLTGWETLRILRTHIYKLKHC